MPTQTPEENCGHLWPGGLWPTLRCDYYLIDNFASTEKRIALHDTECPNWDKVSLNNTNIDMYNDKISSPEELGTVVEHKQTLGEFMVCNNHNNLTGLGLTFRDCQNKDHFVPVPVLYYDSTTCVGNVFSSTSYDCHKYLTSANDNGNMCWKDPGVISKTCGGIFLTPFPILKMIYLQNIRIQVKAS